jgi:hypothetical protein
MRIAAAAVFALVAPLLFAVGGWAAAPVELVSVSSTGVHKIQTSYVGVVSCHRRNSQYNVCHGAYSAGTSRHGAPTRIRHRIPSINCRLLHFGGRPLTDAAGSTAARTAHCASLRSCRLVTAKVATRSPELGASWSIHQIPETSLFIDHRHTDTRSAIDNHLPNTP